MDYHRVLFVAVFFIFNGILGLARASLNIDLLTPTVVRSGLTSGEVEGFGFTLTQHQFSDGRQTVLVSAPKANGTYQREGGVYSCPLVNGGSCQFESVFQSTFNVMDDPFAEGLSSLPLSFEDQLLGYSLRSFENHVVACAPLYIHRPTRITAFGTAYDITNPNGRCIILDRELNGTTLVQLFSGNIDSGSLMLAGVDTGILGQQPGPESLVFGSVFSGGRPIPRGQVFHTNLAMPFTNTISNEPRVASLVPLTGYHIDSGVFTTPGVRQIVTSAPRSDDHFGRVEILSVGVTLVTVGTLIGMEADGYFGYDFAVVNFDPEGGELDSLVIGCPLCDRERGHVYVYSHTGNTGNPFTESVIDAPSSSNGRFGLSVENIGDIDLDGIEDIAVSAPYEGAGVVYVYRGSPSGLIANEPQIIPAQSGSSAFGYMVTGGADIDGNRYPDITISDLSGNQVTSYRTSPLVNVTFDLESRQEVLDILGDDDRRCPLSDNVNLPCFNVTPCFQFDSRFGDVTRFALSYMVTVDEANSRASLYQVDSVSGDVTLGSGSYSGTVTMENPGERGRVCVSPLTFALSADFTDTSPIRVQLTIDDIPEPLPLETTPSSTELGGALHPILRRYQRGDIPIDLSLQYEISFNLNCSSGLSSECEPIYQLSVEENFSTDSSLVLAPDNVFGYLVTVNNTAGDDGLNPTLSVQLPQGVVFERFVSLTPSAVTECNTRSSTNSTGVQCSLRNPTLARSTLRLEIFFGLNVSALSLDTNSLEFTFRVIDGSSGNESASMNTNASLEAIGDYGISSVVSEEEYQAFRGTIYRNATTIPLNETGPQLNFRVSVRNTRESTNGTAFPRTTLLIHLPVELRLSGRPLLIPTEVVVTSGTVNCSHSGALPQGLSVIQQPIGFIPPWTGPPPSAEQLCRNDSQFTCGTILCTIVNLEPSPGEPAELTLFARLFSPGVLFDDDLSILSQLIPENQLPRQGVGSVTESMVLFRVFPAVTEVLVECVPYWVVVVSVVVGILALMIIITILALCGLFRRWYKNKKKAELSNGNGVEQTDSELFQRRTIPPIPGITPSGRGQPELTHYAMTGDDGLEEEKDKEAEEEAELEREIMKMDLDKEGYLDFDPAQGVHDDDGGVETDL